MLKDKINPLFFLFTLFLSGFFFSSPVFAIEGNYGAEVHEFGYDSNGLLYLDIEMKNQNDYDYIIFSDNILTTKSATRRYDTPSNGHLEIGVNLTGNKYSWLCEDVETITISSKLYYKISPDDGIVRCFPLNIWDTNSYEEYYNINGITKSVIDNKYSSNFLETIATDFYQTISYYKVAGGVEHDENIIITFPYESIPSPVDGVCGLDNGEYLTQSPPTPPLELCSSGVAGEVYEDLIFNKDWRWTCYGNNGGENENCQAFLTSDPVDGVCGSEDGQSVAELDYNNLCSVGWYGGSVVNTFDGWAWNCYGFNNGNTDYCSAINTGAEDPPTLPDISDIPTPTDCSAYSGIDAILCNLGNMIQGIFLPSSDKMIELQTAINRIGNVFPFNYIQAIANIFSNVNPTSGGLTMTIWGNTETLSAEFLELPLFDNIKTFFTILISIGFLFWGINYIKHFF